MSFEVNRPMSSGIGGAGKSYGESKDQQLSLVFSTRDYGKFSFFDENREVSSSSSHVSNLVKCLLQSNFLKSNPIKVTKEFKIIDGQNRFLAAKRAGVEIYYIFEDKDPFEVMLESNKHVKPWGTKDFINFSAKRGHNDHKMLIEAQTKYGLTTQTLGVFALDDGQVLEMPFRKWVRSETFKIGNKEHFEFICETYSDFIAIVSRNTAKKISYLKSERAAKAFKVLSTHPNFDRERFLLGADRCPHFVDQHLNMSGYITMFEKIYNYHQKDKLKINEIHGEE
jgi:hypothetical protein